MALKNLNEFTDAIVGLIHDAKAIETKVKTLREVTKNNAKYYFDEIDLNIAKVEQTLTDLFAIHKPLIKEDKLKPYVIVADFKSDPPEFIFKKDGTNLRTIFLDEATRYSLEVGEKELIKINSTKRKSGNKNLSGLMHIKNFK